MLADDLPPKHIAFSRINAEFHDELAHEVKLFEASGGKIKQCAIGETADFQTINAKAEAIKRGGQNGANTKKLDAKLKRSNNEN